MCVRVCMYVSKLFGEPVIFSSLASIFFFFNHETTEEAKGKRKGKGYKSRSHFSRLAFARLLLSFGGS